MIHRRWPDTIFFGIIGFGLLGWAVDLFRGSFIAGGLASIFGLALVALATLGPASGACPVCGEMLHGLFAVAIAEHERCPHCRRYFRRSDSTEVPEDYVSATPQFRS